MTRAVLMPPGSDIFASGCEALVNPVDAATGAQGKGLALAFKKRWPVASGIYKQLAVHGDVDPGSVWAIRPNERHGVWIFFVATKRDWREKSELSYIRDACNNLVLEVARREVRGLALPAIGCGLGGLSWDEVRPLLLDAAERMSGVEVKIYEPW